MHAALTIGHRRRRNMPPTHTYSSNDANVRNRVQLAPHRAPDPPRQGATPARPAMTQVFQSVNKRQIRSVMRDFFAFGKPEYRIGAGQPDGGHLPHRERANIKSPGPEAYGSQFALQPTPDAEEARIRLLSGMVG